MISMRYFNEGVSENFLCLIPLKGTTTARDVCSALLKFGEENDLTWENLVSLCTDGAPSMLGRQAGFVALFRQEIGKPNLKRVLADVLNSLETAFSGRFADFAAIDDVYWIFASPFTA